VGGGGRGRGRIAYMRWLRPHIEALTQILSIQEVSYIYLQLWGSFGLSEVLQSNIFLDVMMGEGLGGSKVRYH
jgi:hypothetical protein